MVKQSVYLANLGDLLSSSWEIRGTKFESNYAQTESEVCNWI